jgi:hypothetical protein
MYISKQIGKFRIAFVFHYRFEKQEDEAQEYIFRLTHFRDWRISIWFKRSKIVGMKNFRNPKEWNKHLVGNYMIGVDLLIITFWVSFDYGGMYMNIDEN